MKGDFSRVTFDPRNNFLRVLMQQGRVQLDADWNEQIAILLYYLQTLAADLFGPHGGPQESGFQVVMGEKGKYSVKEGHYYVDGILCVNSGDYNLENADMLKNGRNVVYLDVWERHITALEDEHIREVALGGPDTTTRSKVEWAVKIALLEGDYNCNDPNLKSLLNPDSAEPGRLKARVDAGEPSTDPCAIPPTSPYRGVENQLYRVEIHRGGDNPTFKWSRENGSVVFPIEELSGDKVTLKHMGFDERFTLEEEDWVEIITDDYDLTDENNNLFEVKRVDRLTREITLSHKEEMPLITPDSPKHPFLRRWNHEGSTTSDGTNPRGAKNIEAGKWVKLEAGIEIQFVGNDYYPGDYWLIPARTITGNIEWPVEAEGVRPYRVEHHYAPLAIIDANNNDNPTMTDCRRLIEPNLFLPPANND